MVVVVSYKPCKKKSHKVHGCQKCEYQRKTQGALRSSTAGVTSIGTAVVTAFGENDLPSDFPRTVGFGMNMYIPPAGQQIGPVAFSYCNLSTDRAGCCFREARNGDFDTCVDARVGGTVKVHHQGWPCKTTPGHAKG